MRLLPLLLPALLAVLCLPVTACERHLNGHQQSGAATSQEASQR